jgi:predicted ester cyclase
MSAEENKALVRRYIEVVWNKRNTAALDELLAPNYKRYVSATATPLTREGQRQRVTGFHTAFPDIHFTIEDLFAEGDRVAFRATFRGTHQGPFPILQGMAPTGKQVTVSVLDVVRVEHGKFAEHWGGPDVLDLLQQLGAAISAGSERK